MDKNTFQHNFTDAKLIYEGKHNKTFLVVFDQEYYTIRKSKNRIVNHDNEKVFIKKFNDYFFLKNGDLVKKYYYGKYLRKKNESNLSKIKQELVNNFWCFTEYLPIKMEYFINEINDSHYSFLIDKYKKDVQDLVVNHGDLRPKNILIMKNSKKIKLIDFEWVIKNDKYFDLAHLFLYCGFTKKSIIKIFKVDSKKLDDFIYIVLKFNEYFENKNY
ncbi:MAG: hypothetical protein ACRCRZ_01315 [Metamycoplasmataceae bacterium]